MNRNSDPRDREVVQSALMGKMIACYVSSPGPNAISVSLSPMGRYVMVGLASRRILLHPSTEHMVAQVFRLQQPHGGETSMRVSDGSLLLQTSFQCLHFI